jgi:acyl-CoA reductase-like NAD-dependent aldehyde dehydrogenase
VSSKIAEIRRSYVDGALVAGEGPSLAVENPATEETVAEVESLSPAQMEAAVLAARRAFDGGGWSGLRREERIDAVLALGEYLDGRSEELGATLTAEAGSTAAMLGAQVAMPLAHLRAACDIYRTMPDVEHTPRPPDEVILGNRVTASMMRYEPIGVVGAIAASNFPLQTPLWKFVPALLTGSTVVVRPSPLTPIATLVIGEGADAVGLPAGVLNVVVDSGVEGGRLLSSHPGVDCVSFTGSTAVGRAIMAQAAPTVKRVLLELGSGRTTCTRSPTAAGCTSTTGTTSFRASRPISATRARASPTAPRASTWIASRPTTCPSTRASSTTCWRAWMPRP